ncbi:MAG: thioredoxin-disulfide reductase [Clostridiales bacterium]|jgi:thioredoxin reductase (NADPH)|nr:thioredoxin-disulfide reductase [Clostridiales bacterium]
MLKDIIIIGGGVAGLTAGLYAKRGGMDTLLIEKMFPGGQIATTYMVENYPGFDEPIGGPELAMKLEAHARKFGLEILYDEVAELKLDDKIKKVITSGGEYQAKALILCMGAEAKTLGLDKEDLFRGRGVSYCATCDGAFYKDKYAAIVGGGDTAVEDAVFLAQHARKVYLIHRRDALRASKILQDRLFQNPKIEILWDTVVDEILGEQNVEGLLIRNVKDGSKKELKVDGLFVAIGMKPNNGLILGKVMTDESGFVTADENMATNIPGVFVAGDLRKKPLWQIITAAADGAVASISAQRYIMEKFE